MSDIDCIRMHLEIAEVAKRTQSDMPSIVNFRDALSRLETLRAELAARDERIAGLEAVVRNCDSALETLVYEITHLSPERDDGVHQCRISKGALIRAREARSAAKAALDE